MGDGLKRAFAATARTRPDAELTPAQRDLIVRMGFVPNAPRNWDEATPMWWLEGRPGAVKANVARSLIKRGYVACTGHWGGQPGVQGFTITEAGRKALALPASAGRDR